MGLFSDLMALLAKFVKWLGVLGILKLCLIVFGAGFLVVGLHFVWLFVWSMFQAIGNVWTHRGQIFSTSMIYHSAMMVLHR